jgi:hypothetical protein
MAYNFRQNSWSHFQHTSSHFQHASSHFEHTSWYFEHTSLYFEHTSLYFEHTSLYFEHTSCICIINHLYFWHQSVNFNIKVILEETGRTISAKIQVCIFNTQVRIFNSQVCIFNTQVDILNTQVCTQWPRLCVGIYLFIFKFYYNFALKIYFKL